MTTHTSLIKRLRAYPTRMQLLAADALEALGQQVAALTVENRNYQVAVVEKNLQIDMLTKERDDLERISSIQAANAFHLAAAQAREAKLREEVNNALKWAVPTSPCHHHLTMGIALPADDTALMERLKEERDAGYAEALRDVREGKLT